MTALMLAWVGLGRDAAIVYGLILLILGCLAAAIALAQAAGKERPKPPNGKDDDQ